MHVRPSLISYYYLKFLICLNCLANANDGDQEAAAVTATAGPNSQPSQLSIPDEDPLDEAVTDLNVLAEVTLSKKPSACSTINFLIIKS